MTWRKEIKKCVQLTRMHLNAVLQGARGYLFFLSFCHYKLTRHVKQNTWACRSGIRNRDAIPDWFNSRRRSHKKIYLTSIVTRISRPILACLQYPVLNAAEPIRSLILVQKHLEQAADLRSIDEEKIKTREAHRRQILRYSVYLLYYHFYHIA